ncbi:MAG: hypothetical protein ABR973_01575 [Candidatus Acidiferrales bacterium]|jgi:hypothetical protein
MQGGKLQQITSVPISDGRLQLLAVDNKNTIWTTVQAGLAWNGPWTSWIPFVTDGAPADGGLFNLTGARMLDGSVTLWALGQDPDSSGSSIWAINRSASSTASQFSSPNAGWGSWAEFEPQYVGAVPPPELTDVKGILAVTGGSFSYLWAYGNLGDSPAQWYLNWTIPPNSPPIWGQWNPFPVPASEQTDFRSMAVGVLPEGGLQLFVLEVGKLGPNGFPSFTKIATAWQILGGSSPMEWTFNNGHPWEDFSLS